MKLNTSAAQDYEALRKAAESQQQIGHQTYQAQTHDAEPVSTVGFSYGSTDSVTMPSFGDELIL